MKLNSLFSFITAVMVTFTQIFGQAQKNADSKGEEIFRQLCVGCHGPDGKAQTDMGRKVHAADLTSPKVQQMSDSQLAKTVENGNGKMPAFGEMLSEGDVDQLVKYIRTLGGKQ